MNKHRKNTRGKPREGAKTRPIGPESFLLLSFSRFKSKIGKVWDQPSMSGGINQVSLKGPTNRYVSS